MNIEDLEWKSSGPLLICGNLPWVTTDALSRLVDDYQLKIRDNPKNLKGLDALTGSGSFDISERLALRFVSIAIEQRNANIALLLKESVARRVLVECRNQFAKAAVVKVDSREWFDVKVSSCLLHLQFMEGALPVHEVEYYQDFEGECTEVWTLYDGIVRRRSKESRKKPPVLSNITWRHGIKHDAAAVFELDLTDARDAEQRAIFERSAESSYLYPLVTARSLQRADLQTFSRYMLVPQKRLGDTSIESDAQGLVELDYLRSKRDSLLKRRSSIYRKKPFYAIFGIGHYSFAPFKAAVAGLYLRPRFCFLGPVHGKPIVLGDTAYFFPSDSAIDAAIIVALGNEAVITAEICEMAFTGKRPITKRLLDSLDFKRAFDRADSRTLEKQVVELIEQWGPDKLEVPQYKEISERADTLLRNLVA